jgi:hypothetical protein
MQERLCRLPLALTELEESSRTHFTPRSATAAKERGCESRQGRARHPNTVEVLVAPVDLAHLALLALTLGSGAWLLNGFVRGLRQDNAALRRLAEELAPAGPRQRWRRGFLVGAVPERMGFCVDVFTEGTRRAGVVDVWRVKQERPGLAAFEGALVRRSGQGLERYDLEGARELERLVLAGPRVPELGTGEAAEALRALLARRRLRSLYLREGALEVSVERDAGTPAELMALIADVKRLALALAARAALPVHGEGPLALGGTSGAPVGVPLQAVRSGSES